MVLFLVGLWFGAIFITALSVPLTFTSVDSLMLDPPKEASRLVQAVGPVSLRAVLRHQVAEAGRTTFSVWGWIQLGLAALILALHVFALPVQKLSLALAATMTVLSATMKFLLVPRIREVAARELTSFSSTSPEQYAYRFLYQGFAAFEAAIVILGLVLVWNLFRRREASPSSPVLEGRADLLSPRH